MFLQINEDYRITSDSLNYIIEERSISGDRAKVQGEERWKSISYHTSIPSAIKWFAEREIRLSDASGVKEVVEAVERVGKVIQEALKGVEGGRK